MLDSLGIQVFKEMVHFKSNDNLSLAQAKAFFFFYAGAAGWSYIRLSTDVE